MDKNQFLAQFKDYSVFPICEELVFDMDTAINTFYKFLDRDDVIFLEGISSSEQHGRYSYLALDAYLKLICHEKHYLINKGHTEEKFDGTVFDALTNLLEKYSMPINTPDYITGVYGTISYEVAAHSEAIDLPKKRSLNTPFAEFMIPKITLVFDKHYHRMTLCYTIFKDDIDDKNSTPDQAYDEAIRQLDQLKDIIKKAVQIEPAFLSNEVDHYQEINATFNREKDRFYADVERCKKYIYDGDIFQIQISRRASVPYSGNPFHLYRYLRNFNPSPLMFYLKNKDNTLIGASPEILVNVADNKMIIRPIAGTRKRYSKDRTEAEIIEELTSDPKEKAEHIMLVDLARNDIGRACDLASVEVTDLMIVEKYTHVMHMVSEVQGRLKKDMTAVDALKYGFPAGTVTGAPKIRAMEIIAELEDEQREFYSGGIVFFDFKGNLKTALTIRSILVKDNMAYTQAAAGVVADSVPEDEFKETNNKMRSCLSAMTQFGDKK